MFKDEIVYEFALDLEDPSINKYLENVKLYFT